jgi:hypothetical protein
MLGILAIMDSLKLDSGEWNESVVRGSFFSDDVDLILSIAPSLSKMEDTLVWHFNPSRCYSVRSGYWLEQNFVSKPQYF